MKVTFNEIDLRMGDIFQAVSGDLETLRKSLEQDASNPLHLEGIVIDRVYTPVFGGGAEILFFRAYGEQGEGFYVIFDKNPDPKPKIHTDFEDAREDFTDRMLAD